MLYNSLVLATSPLTCIRNPGWISLCLTDVLLIGLGAEIGGPDFNMPVALHGPNLNIYLDSSNAVNYKFSRLVGVEVESVEVEKMGMGMKKTNLSGHGGWQNLNSLRVNPSYSYADSGTDSSLAEFRDE
ncbi:hypothetical protein DUI87_21359 [Hirundo rustica rustica]|uniref:Uncharacterized protein n=1 Tax=Hirundo rustica rustica TaxID=333673 RepID=A0A3M0JMC9_HIRRU|nr:hypothetical protein DUI87_21359 [Hirundo rustica rustica]